MREVIGWVVDNLGVSFWEVIDCVVAVGNFRLPFREIFGWVADDLRLSFREGVGWVADDLRLPFRRPVGSIGL